jgi:phage replication O-like protein O
VSNTADVQLEHGYARVANEIFEVMAKTPLNGTQWRILMVVFRQSFGFGRKDCALSESYISVATGIDKRSIRREITSLIKNNFIKVVEEANFTTPRVIQFNKNYDEWQRANLSPVGNIAPADSLAHTPEDKSAHTPEGESAPQVNILFKDNINKLLPQKPKKADKPKKPKPETVAYGEYGNVTLTAEEYQKLCTEFGDKKTQQAISFLSAYKIEKKYKTQSDYLTMRRWVFNALEQPNYGNQTPTADADRFKGVIT